MIGSSLPDGIARANRRRAGHPARRGS